jgi:hypothetical protein
VTLLNVWAQDIVGRKTQRPGVGYAGYVSADGVRIIVQDWYKR